MLQYKLEIKLQYSDTSEQKNEDITDCLYLNGIKLENYNTLVENYSLETSDGYCTGTDSSSFHSYTNVAGELFVRILLLPKTYIFIFQ
jgi:hypothetical protein